MAFSCNTHCMDDYSAWFRPKLNAKITLNHHQHPHPTPPPTTSFLENLRLSRRLIFLGKGNQTSLLSEQMLKIILNIISIIETTTYLPYKYLTKDFTQRLHKFRDKVFSSWTLSIEVSCPTWWVSNCYKICHVGSLNMYLKLSSLSYQSV